MTNRLPAIHLHAEPDTTDDQLDFAVVLDRMTRREFGGQPAGHRPLGDPARYCHALIPAVAGDGSNARPGTLVLCAGALVYGTDWLGRTVARCQRERCKAVHLIPRIVPAAALKFCDKGHALEGYNLGYSAETGKEWCRRCKYNKNRRAKDKAKRAALGENEAAA